MSQQEWFKFHVLMIWLNVIAQTQYLCREQPLVHSVLWPPGIVLTPVEMELAQPVFVLQGAPFQRCSIK